MFKIKIIIRAIYYTPRAKAYFKRSLLQILPDPNLNKITLKYNFYFYDYSWLNILLLNFELFIYLNYFENSQSG